MNKNVYPDNSSPEDFECFGPRALRDGEFEGTMIADMGCFTQDGKDSNKAYMGSVVQHKTSKRWYAYFEWGRTGASKPNFQFVECSSKEHAQSEYCKQLHSKNDKRGETVVIAGIKTLRAKAGKDCYLVRPQTTGSTGLPDARRIRTSDGTSSKTVPVVAAKASSKIAKAKPSVRIDPKTVDLLRDLNVGTVNYTKTSMSNSSIPTQTAIDEARQLLSEAQKRLAVVGGDINDQVHDQDLRQFTSVLYSRIPKVKKVGEPEEKWMLTKDNILGWQSDLDAFESAIYANVAAVGDADPYGGLPLEMAWIDPRSSIGSWLYRWAQSATRNKHSNVGTMRILNAWVVSRHGDERVLAATQEEISKENNGRWTRERPLFQDDARPGIPSESKERYAKSNTHLLFHGTRSINVVGLLRKSFCLPQHLVGVSITGALYGNSIYHADDWKKSAGYTSLTSSYWASGSVNIFW